jgi:hypothetical protein
LTKQSEPHISSEDEMEDSEEEEEEMEEYEVEDVQDFQPSSDGTQYYIKWKGYNESQNTWQSKLDMENSQEMLDKIKQIMTEKTLIVVKDMQKELPIPKLIPQPTDYYRIAKLKLHNFGIFNCNDSSMDCFLWSEYDGKKTADEIITATYIYLKQYLTPKHQILKLWSDNCVSQNCCWKILYFYASLLYKFKLKKVVIKTFAVGHTFTLCDAYFGTIENYSYKKNIRHQQDWQDLMNEIKGVTAQSIKNEEFLDWMWLLKYWRPNKYSLKDGTYINDIRGFYSYSLFLEDGQTILRVKHQSHDPKPIQFNITKMPFSIDLWEENQKYDAKLAIQTSKAKGLMQLRRYFHDLSKTDLDWFFPLLNQTEFTLKEQVAILEKKVNSIEKQIEHYESLL